MYGITAQFGEQRGMPIKKPWRISCVNSCLPERLDKLCDRTHTHARCEGREVRPTQVYTPEIAKIVHMALSEGATRKTSSKSAAAAPTTTSGTYCTKEPTKDITIIHLMHGLDASDPPGIGAAPAAVAIGRFLGQDECDRRDSNYTHNSSSSSSIRSVPSNPSPPFVPHPVPSPGRETCAGGCPGRETRAAISGVAGNEGDPFGCVGNLRDPQVDGRNNSDLANAAAMLPNEFDDTLTCNSAMRDSMCYCLDFYTKNPLVSGTLSHSAWASCISTCLHLLRGFACDATHHVDVITDEFPDISTAAVHTPPSPNEVE